MIRLLSMLLFICAIRPATAQKINFNDTANKWITCNRYPYGHINPPSYADSISKDTTINTYTYYYHTRYQQWIREDAGGEKFYYWDGNTLSDEIFMDFTMQVGDTLNYRGTGYKTALQKIDSVQINGVYHRLQTFAALHILEGIGPEFAAYGGLEYMYFPTCCFMQNGMQAAIAPHPWSNFGRALSVGSTPSTPPQATVCPNPTAGSSHIILSQPTSGRLTITNALGQQIANTTFTNQTKLALPALPSGVYCYRIAAINSPTFAGRFVVE